MCVRTSVASRAKIFLLVALAVLAGLTVSTGRAFSNSPEVPKHVPILEIILNCPRFDGREVTVLGAVALEFENQTVCPTKEFLEADTLNCLWLSTDESWPQNEVGRVTRAISRGDYLVIDGRVSCNDRGHLSLYGGTLHQITLLIHESRSEILWDASANESKP
jgi:hypothetical protein